MAIISAVSKALETQLSGWSSGGHNSGCIVTEVPFFSRFPMRSMDCIILLCSSRGEENQKIERKQQEKKSFDLF